MGVSFIYSVCAALAVAALILMACRIITKSKSKLGRTLEYSLLVPWLLPTTMIALGFITTYNTPHWFMFNKVLTGTVLAIFALNFNSLLADYDMSVFLYHLLSQPIGVYINTRSMTAVNAECWAYPST